MTPDDREQSPGREESSKQPERRLRRVPPGVRALIATLWVGFVIAVFQVLVSRLPVATIGTLLAVLITGGVGGLVMMMAPSRVVTIVAVVRSGLSRDLDDIGR